MPSSVEPDIKGIVYRKKTESQLTNVTRDARVYNVYMPRSRTAWLVILLVIAAGVFPFVYIYLRLGVGLHPPLSSLPAREMDRSEQLAQAAAGLVIKPAYMFISLIIIVVLAGRTAVDLRALQWGQVAFLAGEVFCAINFYVFRHESLISEYLHSFGMAVAFGFTAFALWEGVDERLLKLTGSPGACAALKVCGRCTRHEAAGCKARAVTRFLLPAAAILAAIPFLAPLEPQAYAVSIFGFPYSYARLEPYEFYERRALPAMAMLSFVVALIPLLRKGEPPLPLITRLFASAGLGALGFSMFRVTLDAVFVGNLVWFEFWEEATELIFIAAVAFTLWQFRHAVFGDKSPLEILGIV